MPADPSGNAALYMNPEAYDAAGKRLMGRHSAGESFLKGYIRHADVDRFWFWNATSQSPRDLDKFVSGLALRPGPDRHWINRHNFQGLRAPGALHIPGPTFTKDAWLRQELGPRAYSLTGVTHTTATARIMDTVGDLILAPVQPWDSVICTSQAVRTSVEDQLEGLREHLQLRLGARTVPMPRLDVIPLGIEVDRFQPDPEARKRWRAELNLAEDTVVALYVGRFNQTAKMHPVPMAQALEEAARRTGAKIAWVAAGWSEDKDGGDAYHDGVRSMCPSVDYHVLDGRLPDVRKTIWSVGDFFLSLSDNVQETFGLTPLEAMAAGIPCVVSDWDGYRETVRHGQDGFRVTTYMARPGLGGSLARGHAMGWDSYAAYVGGAAHFTAVDIDEAAAAVVSLVENPDLRRRMGRAAREHAQTFDWSRIVPQYQALWAELARVRAVETPSPSAVENPWRPDPFRLFAGYPSERLVGSHLVSLRGPYAPRLAKQLLAAPMTKIIRVLLPDWTALQPVLERVAARGQISVAELLADAGPDKQVMTERTVLWLAKFGVLAIHPRQNPGVRV